MIGLTAGPVLGQQAAPSAPPAGFVAVVGDVERCGNYPVPSDSPLTVHQAVQNAGLVSETHGPAHASRDARRIADDCQLA